MLRKAETVVPQTQVVRELQAALKGEVRFDEGARALYATDGSNYRQTPIGVVIPRDIADVEQTFAICRRHGLPLLSRGAGTSLAGQTCNEAVIIDYSKYLNHILDLDPEARRARVEPGCVLDHLRQAAERHHLTFGPDPSTHSHNTLGGMIGNNSCGTHSVMAGRTVDNVQRLEILTYDGLRLWVGPTSPEELDAIIRAGGRRGQIYQKLAELRDRYAKLIRERYPQIPRRVSGYNLDELLPEKGFNIARALVGTEGTCVAVLQAELQLVPSPPVRNLVVLGYPDVYTATDHIMAILDHHPLALEGIDDKLIDDMRKKSLHIKDLSLLPEGGGWLLVELGGDSEEEARARGRDLMEALRKEPNPPHMILLDGHKQTQEVWRIRESGLGATAWLPQSPPTWEGWEDAAVPPAQLGVYLREFHELLKRYDYDSALYGHFGDGCVHVRINFDLMTAEGIAKYHDFTVEAADLVLRHGGSLSGEHGDGLSRADLLPKMYGKELIRAFEEFKGIWDPQNRMNPGKVVNPHPRTSNLRLGTSYNPPHPQTDFLYRLEGDYTGAAIRCVGVGKCRDLQGGTMCPSYRGSLEEKYSTRGRARLLFEMLRGDPLPDGFDNEYMADALDHCLGCKSCKSECPVNVDMATYKAEFLAHHYRGKLRPRRAYAFGLLNHWFRLASWMPELANFAMQAPGLSDAVKWLVQVSPQRELPEVAPQSFRSWFAGHRSANPQGTPVLLWPDTFNNYFYPEVLQAAVEGLEAAGFKVEIPQAVLCCGRPLYDFGMLDQARRRLYRILEVLRPHIRAGVPMVGLEPSCTAVFRDELCNLLRDEDAKRLRQQTYIFSEFLHKYAPEYPMPKLPRKALVHGHCHHKAIMGMEADKAVFARLGLDWQLLDSGCCGMAGAFGFAHDKYEMSMRIGNQVLLPAVREAAPQTLIITDGFSCREQIRQSTPRQALHTAQVMALALARQRFLDEGVPEAPIIQARQARRQQAAGRAGIWASAGVAFASTALRHYLRHR